MLETSPARYYELLISSFNYTSRSAGTEILDFYTSSQSNYKAPLAVLSRLNENNEAQFSGIGVFKGLTYVGEIDASLLIGHLLIASHLNEASIAVTSPTDESKKITLTIKETNRPKIKVNLNGTVPHAQIKLFIEAHLDSSGSSIDFYQKENMELLNDLIKKEIEETVSSYLEKTIELDADAAGLGRFAKQNYLTWPEFENIHWKDIYHQLEYHLDIESKLNISQVITNSIPTFKE